MMFNSNVSTALICYKCARNVILASSNTWTAQILDKPVSKQWCYLTFVYCSDCLTGGMEAYVNTRMVMHPSNIPNPAHNLAKDIQSLNPMPLRIHTVRPDEREPHPGSRVYADKDDSFINIESVYTVMRGMMGRYTVMSMVEGTVAEPCSDFLMFGDVQSMPLLLYPTPTLVNNIMLCPLCWRNVIFTGSCSIMDTTRLTVRSMRLNLLMYTCCDVCYHSNDRKVTDVDVIDALHEDAAKGSNAIAHFSRYLGNDLYIYKSEDNVSNKVVDANLVMQRLALSSDKWSLIEGKRRGPYIGFV